MQEALTIPWRRREDFAYALPVPLALLAGLMLAWYFAGELLRPFSGWALYLGYCLVFAACFTLFAVNCHRLVLLAPPRRLGAVALPAWSRREGRFLFWMVTLWIAYMATVWAALALFTFAFSWSREIEGWFDPLQSAAKFAAFYVVARFSLVFPATAIDRVVDFKWAWRTSRGNGWRLVVVVMVLPWMVSQLIGFLYREDPSAAEVVLITLLGTALFALEIAALSVAYRELTKDEPRP